MSLAILLLAVPQQDEAAAWGRQYGYKPGQVHEIRLHRRMPFVDVEVDGSTVPMLFDTGNMAGLVIDSEEAKKIGLRVVDTWKRLDSGGTVVDQAPVFEAASVRALGVELKQRKLFGRDEYNLKGLLGPRFFTDGRITFDYEAGYIGIGPSEPDGDSAIERVPLTQAERFRGLIVLRGRVNGREVLVEVDTGKTRSVIDPLLVEEFGLEITDQGVPIESIELASYQFSIPLAKVKSFAGISHPFPEPILLGIGADILRQIVFTVDYSRGDFVIHERTE